MFSSIPRLYMYIDVKLYPKFEPDGDAEYLMLPSWREKVRGFWDKIIPRIQSDLDKAEAGISESRKREKENRPFIRQERPNFICTHTKKKRNICCQLISGAAIHRG